MSKLRMRLKKLELIAIFALLSFISWKFALGVFLGIVWLSVGISLRARRDPKDLRKDLEELIELTKKEE